MTKLTSDHEMSEIRAVHALVRAQYEAWARGDADAFGATFTDDADYIAFDGTHFKGRQQIAECHRELFGGLLRGTKLVAETLVVRLLAPTVALVHATGAAMNSKQERIPRSKLSVNTSIAVKVDDAWLFAAFQNTRFRPWKETLLGRLVVLFNR
jgi:uncharacterized protein (TIGR02246 family)